MNNKGFVYTHTNIETRNDVDVAEKPLKSLNLEETEAKELKKNIFILLLLIIGVRSFGIYLSF